MKSDNRIKNLKNQYCEIRKYDLSESDESEDEGLKAIREHESCIDE